MLDRRAHAHLREKSSTASEKCFLCSRRIWPGDGIARLQGVTVHGPCFERDVQPQLEPGKTSHS